MQVPVGRNVTDFFMDVNDECVWVYSQKSQVKQSVEILAYQHSATGMMLTNTGIGIEMGGIKSMARSWPGKRAHFAIL
tara:strand:- start:426 stop:659 length:234 start_codon:yes stop_codon:yes gene_type:complete